MALYPPIRNNVTKIMEFGNVTKNAEKSEINKLFKTFFTNLKNNKSYLSKTGTINELHNFGNTNGSEVIRLCEIWKVDERGFRKPVKSTCDKYTEITMTINSDFKCYTILKQNKIE